MDVGSARSVAANNLANKIGSLSCVTKHSSFYSLCLDIEVFLIARCYVDYVVVKSLSGQLIHNRAQRFSLENSFLNYSSRFVMLVLLKAYANGR